MIIGLKPTKFHQTEISISWTKKPTPIMKSVTIKDKNIILAGLQYPSPVLD